jgi:hypothetical protein
MFRVFFCVPKFRYYHLIGVYKTMEEAELAKKKAGTCFCGIEAKISSVTQ